MELSDSSKRLIGQFVVAKNAGLPEQGVPMIHVDEVASRVAAFYERIRTVVEWKEEHLMRRAAIIRKLKRRFLEINASDVGQINNAAEGLVKELIRGGHFENDKIPESKIFQISAIIAKYATLRRNPDNTSRKTGLQFQNWLIEVAACEIEDLLSPAIKEKALIEYMFWTMKERVKIQDRIYEENLIRHGDEDIQLYIAVCQALFKLDLPIISYNLLQYRYANWRQASTELIESVSGNIFAIWKEIMADMENPISHKFYAVCERFDTPYLLLGDILSNNNPDQMQLLQDPSLFEDAVKSAYKKRLAALDGKISRAAIYLTLSIFLTKILLLIILEWIIGIVTGAKLQPAIIALDILIPTVLMFLLVASVKKPSKKNLNLVVMETIKVFYVKEQPDIYEIKLASKKNLAMRVFLSLMYVVSAFVTLGIIYYILHWFGFPITSIIIDILFISLILFAGTAIGKRAQELTMEPEKEGFLSFIADIFVLPMQGIGNWISSTWRQYNAVAAFFNALIDMPFTAFVELLEGWRLFVQERKEEIR